MSSPGGENIVGISVTGATGGAVDSLMALGDAVNTTASLTERLQAVLAATPASSGMMSDAFAAASGAMSGMADAAVASADALQADGLAATETGGRLDALAAMARNAMAALANVGGVIGGGMGVMGDIGGAVGLSGGNLMGMFGAFGGALDMAVGKMGGFLSMAGSMVTGMLAFSALDEGIHSLKDFTDQMVQLNIATEKNQFSWKYLYGGAENAQKIADWTKSFSMQIPYTRQSLLDAVTNLAPLGLSVAGLEHYMPLIADLGATRAPNLDIARVAQVIMSASMGYTRMLKYDLKINPEELIKYGLDATGRGIGMHINDPTTLLPALENYAKAKGLSGAAKDIAHNTFWGAWSSFMDRIQNFQLEAGSKLFANLKNDLVGFSDWIDQHSSQVAAFADLIANGVGGAFHTAVDWISQFGTGIGQTGLFDFLNAPPPPPTATPESTHYTPVKPGIQHPGRPRGRNAAQLGAGQPVVMDAPSPAALTGWQQAGQMIGGALKLIGEGWKDVSSFFSPIVQQYVSDLGAAFTDFKNSFTPDEQDTLKKVGLALLAIPWLALTGVVIGLTLAFKALGLILPRLVDLVQWFSDHPPSALLGGALTGIASTFQGWADGLKSAALGWGKNIIAALIQGITAMIPGLTGIMADVGALLGGSLPSSAHAGGSEHKGGQNTRSGNGLSLALHGGYLPQRASNSSTVINIYGSSTLEVQKIIDDALERAAAHANRMTRAPGGYALYQAGTIGGLR